jgi:putative membrane protein
MTEHLWSLCLAGVHTVTPANLWLSWSLAPSIVVPLTLALAVGLYGYGARRLPELSDGEVTRRRTWFIAGWLLLALALISPLCRMAATLVSAHMVQLMLLAGPATALLALARPGRALTAAIPAARYRLQPRTAASRPSRVGVATLGYGAAIWLWHAPPIYTAIVSSALWHWLAFAALIAVSLVFWARIVAALRHDIAAALAALLGTLMHTGLLGALLTFAPRILYPVLADGASAWHLEPLQDQQLAGLIMWVGGGVFYLLAALLGCTLWLRMASAGGAAPARG